jgi:hypothetical protein
MAEPRREEERESKGRRAHDRQHSGTLYRSWHRSDSTLNIHLVRPNCFRIVEYRVRHSQRRCAWPKREAHASASSKRFTINFN